MTLEEVNRLAAVEKDEPAQERAYRPLHHGQGKHIAVVVNDETGRVERREMTHDGHLGGVVD
jgi:hypothetical protein